MNDNTSSFDWLDENCLDEFGYSRLADHVSGGILYEMTKSGYAGRLQAQFDITITNKVQRGGWGSFQPPVTVELFNHNNSFIYAENKSYDNSNIITPAYPGGYDLSKKPFTPKTIRDQVANAVANSAPGNEFSDFGRIVDSNAVYVDNNGSVILNAYRGINFITFDQIGQVTISCRQVPYIALLKSSALQPFWINKLRIFYNNGQSEVFTPAFPAKQVAEPLYLFSHTFLGKEKENILNPSSYKKPTQYQNYVIDVPISFQVDGESGIRYTIHSPDINVGELSNSVEFVMNLSRYYKHELKPL